MAAVTRKRVGENYFWLRVERWGTFKVNISSQSKAQCWFRKRKTELKIIEKTKICIPAMLKPYSASSFCLPNKNRVGVAHGDGTNLEVVYTPRSKCLAPHRMRLTNECHRSLHQQSSIKNRQTCSKIRLLLRTKTSRASSTNSVIPLDCCPDLGDPNLEMASAWSHAWEELL